MAKIFLEDCDKVERILNAILTKGVKSATEQNISKGAMVTAFVYNGKTTIFSQVLGGKITKEFYTDDELKRETYAKNKDLRDATERIRQMVKLIAFSNNPETVQIKKTNNAKGCCEICFYDDLDENTHNYWYFTAFAGSDDTNINFLIANKGCSIGWWEVGLIKEPNGEIANTYRIAGKCQY